MFSLLVLTLFFSRPVFSQIERDQGEITFEFRRFEQDQKFETYDKNLSLYGKIDTIKDFSLFKAIFSSYGRVDADDNERSLLVLQDGYVEKSLDEEELYNLIIGFKVFNWTALEAFHPVDVVNSRNFDSNFENLEKKGELTLGLEVGIWQGSFNFYIWPRVEGSSFPGEKNRTGLLVKVGDQVIVDSGDVSSNSKWQNQFGFIFSQTAGEIDFSFLYLDHYDRLTPLVGYTQSQTYLGKEIPKGGLLQPHYFRVKEVGATFTTTLMDFLIKVEGVSKSFDQSFAVLTPKSSKVFIREVPLNYTSMAVGLEYNFFYESGSEGNLYIEGTSLFGLSKIERSQKDIFQRDIMIAYQHSYNDRLGAEAFLGLIYDLENDNEAILNLKFSKRLNDFWKYNLGTRIYIVNKKGSTGLQSLKNDSYGFLNLSRYF